MYLELRLDLGYEYLSLLKQKKYQYVTLCNLKLDLADEYISLL